MKFQRHQWFGKSCHLLVFPQRVLSTPDVSDMLLSSEKLNFILQQGFLNYFQIKLNVCIPTGTYNVSCFCRSFENNWNIYKLLAFPKPVTAEVGCHTLHLTFFLFFHSKCVKLSQNVIFDGRVFCHLKTNFAMAILNVGAPAGGMNAAVRSAARVALAHGHKVYGVHDGFEGLSNGSVRMPLCNENFYQRRII